MFERVAVTVFAVAALVAASSWATLARGAPAPAAEQAQSAHARGLCGSLGPGTGLLLGKGWIVSMLPGRHELRMAGGGEVFVTAARVRTWDFDAGRPYYLVVEGATPRSVLEWKVPGKDWAAVPVTFLYPPAGVTYPR